MYNLRAVLAAAVGPLVLAAFFLVTSSDTRPYGGTLIIAAVVLAHACFWPAALITNKLALRMRLTDSWHMAVTMGFVTLAVFVLIYISWAAIDNSFSWKGLLRDSLSGAVASAAAYVLYRALLPNKRSAADHARTGA
jgi:hypothetical protein